MLESMQRENPKHFIERRGISGNRLDSIVSPAPRAISANSKKKVSEIAPTIVVQPSYLFILFQFQVEVSEKPKPII